MTWYTGLLFLAIGVSAFTWTRLAQRDRRLVWIYAAALVSALAGAKIGWIFAEGWVWVYRPDAWQIWLTGKTILGALLGGYLGVEVAKKLIGYSKPTGDLFAIVVPMGIIVGRLGCLAQGCCPGVQCKPAWFTILGRDGLARWPAVPAEILFNFTALVVALVLQRREKLTGQLFHCYLMAAGLFRFFHEFLRETPQMIGRLSGYQFLALALFALGAVGYWKRRSTK